MSIQRRKEDELKALRRRDENEDEGRGEERRRVLKTSELERESFLGFYNVRLTLPSSSAIPHQCPI